MVITQLGAASMIACARLADFSDAPSGKQEEIGMSLPLGDWVDAELRLNTGRNAAAKGPKPD
jgi:hypothetical protein